LKGGSHGILKATISAYTRTDLKKKKKKKKTKKKKKNRIPSSLTKI
jgi:hypothetical protein